MSHLCAHKGGAGIVQAQRGHGMQLSLSRTPVVCLVCAEHFEHNGPTPLLNTHDEVWVVAEPWPCAARRRWHGKHATGSHTCCWLPRLHASVWLRATSSNTQWASQALTPHFVTAALWVEPQDVVISTDGQSRTVESDAQVITKYGACGAARHCLSILVKS